MGLIERRADVADRRKSSSFVPQGKNLFEQARKVAVRLEEETPFSPNQKEKVSRLAAEINRRLHSNDRGIASHLQANPFSPAASAVHSAIGISGGVQFPSERT